MPFMSPRPDDFSPSQEVPQVATVEVRVIRRSTEKHLGFLSSNGTCLPQPTVGDTFESGVSSMRIPAVPMKFVFAKQRQGAGLSTLFKALLAIAAGVLLITQIPSTPSLKIQMGLLSALCCVGGGSLLPSAIRDMFGRLKVDGRGIHMTPSYVGFSIPWKELVGWDSDHLAFRFYTSKSKRALATYARYLDASDRNSLYGVLRACVPQKQGVVMEDAA